MGVECFHALKSILHDKGLATAVGTRWVRASGRHGI